MDNFEIIEENLLSNYEIMHVPGDGHCIYRSILQASKYLGKKPGTEYIDTNQGIIGARGFRNQVVKIIEEDTSLALQLGRSLSRRMKSEYIRSLRSNDWGNAAIATLISKYYSVPIAIVSAETGKVINGERDLSGIVLCFYDTPKGQHYDWLKKKKQKTDFKF